MDHLTYLTDLTGAYSDSRQHCDTGKSEIDTCGADETSITPE